MWELCPIIWRLHRPPSRHRSMPFLQNAVGYCRVSTQEQSANGQALDTQIARVRDVIGPDAPLFTDVCSGTKVRRPAFSQMLELLATGLYDHVVITRPDRLGRNQRTGFQQIVDWWVGKNGKKIKTVAIDVPIDLDRMGGRFNLALLSEAAIFEVDMLSCRIRAAHAKKQKDGGTLARPPFGYLCRDGLMIPDTEKRHCCLPRKAEFDEGVSNVELHHKLVTEFLKTGCRAEALKQMEEWTLTRKPSSHAVPTYLDRESNTYYVVRPTFPPETATFRNWLFNPVYRGHRGHRRNYNSDLRPANGETRNSYTTKGSSDSYETIHYDCHPALITKSDYQRILVLEERSHQFMAEKPGRSAANRIRSLSRFPLTGLLQCSCCGRNLRSVNNGPRHKYYRCTNTLCSDRVSIRSDKAALSIAMYLQQKAAAIQSGEEEFPSLSKSNQTMVDHWKKTLDFLKACPEPSLVAGQIQDIQRRIDQLAGSPDTEDFLSGTARQLLLSPKAADWCYWAAFVAEPSALLTRLPVLIESAAIGYASREDRPSYSCEGRKGRPKAGTQGRPTVISVRLR